MANGTVELVGASGKRYQYWANPIDTTFKDEPGNYVYASKEPTGHWRILYVGETSSLSQRLATHEKEDAALRRGATHILAHLSSSYASVRRDEEADLIRRFSPPLN